jgi:hypothetical protein
LVKRSSSVSTVRSRSAATALTTATSVTESSSSAAGRTLSSAGVTVTRPTTWVPSRRRQCVRPAASTDGGSTTASFWPAASSCRAPPVSGTKKSPATFDATVTVTPVSGVIAGSTGTTSAFEASVTLPCAPVAQGPGHGRRA